MKSLHRTSHRAPGAAFSDAPEPPASPGLYPAEPWQAGNGGGNGNAAGFARAASAIEEAPEPPSPLSQYPDEPWAEPAPAVATQAHPPRALEDEADEPPGAPGLYPEPPWASAPPVAAAQELPETLPLSLKEPDYTEELTGPVELEAPTDTAPGAELTNEAIYRIVREVAEADSGDATYSAISADREFETAGHPASQKRHYGLAFGLVLATQESGRLGRVLALTQQRDARIVADILGPDADAVLAVTNAPTAEQRLQPVGGEPLWSPQWSEKFQRLGAEPACQYAQNQEAIDGLFRPMLPVAGGLGITSERGLAMMFDRCVTRGLGGGVNWVARMAGPLRTAAQRAHALLTLGFADLRAFQAATPGLPQDGVLDVSTYAALVAALRRQGATLLPSPRDYVARMLAAATGMARRRLQRLHDSAVLSDTLYHLP